MPSRDYEVEAENILPEGFWPGEPLEAGDRTDLERLMLDAAAVLEMVGGTFSIVAIREEIAPDLWVPRGYRAKWESFAPGRRAQRAEPLAHEVPEPAESAEEPAPEPEAESVPPDVDPMPPGPSRGSEDLIEV